MHEQSRLTPSSHPAGVWRHHRAVRRWHAESRGLEPCEFGSNNVFDCVGGHRHDPARHVSKALDRAASSLRFHGPLLDDVTEVALKVERSTGEFRGRARECLSLYPNARPSWPKRPSRAARWPSACTVAARSGLRGESHAEEDFCWKSTV